MSPERRAQVRRGFAVAHTGWRQTVREIVWMLGLADDGGNPSLSRVFCALFALAAVHGALLRDAPTRWEDIAMGFLAVSGYFGLKGLMIFGRAAAREPIPTTSSASPEIAEPRP